MTLVDRTSIRRGRLAAITAAVVVAALAVAGSVALWDAVQPAVSPAGAPALSPDEALARKQIMDAAARSATLLRSSRRPRCFCSTRVSSPRSIPQGICP
jgi:hypothetical protein